MSTLELATRVSLRHRLDGSGSTALLLFNGATLPLEFWDPVVARLAQRCRVIRFDQRDAGGTRFEGRFTLGDVATDAAALLDALAVDKVVAVGHAWGGRVAQVFVRDHPHRCRGLVVCGTGGQFPATVTFEELAAIRDARRARDRDAFARALHACYCAATYPEQDPHGFAALVDLLWSNPGNGAAEWDPAVNPSPSYWGMARLPALLLYGTEDRNGTPENARDLSVRLATKRLEFVEDAGHFLIRETPERVATEILTFVDELESWREG
ncbi:MAG TPA: alpha/beta hydrolase [Pseudomonadales bacterium]|nr:alpha/beta hydrolase [Pseudomonadales bacterium]